MLAISFNTQHKYFLNKNSDTFMVTIKSNITHVWLNTVAVFAAWKPPNSLLELQLSDFLYALRLFQDTCVLSKPHEWISLTASQRIGLDFKASFKADIWQIAYFTRERRQ